METHKVGGGWGEFELITPLMYVEYGNVFSFECEAASRGLFFMEVEW
jgi:hypothetical protein